MRVVAKVGTSSVTGPDGAIDERAVEKISGELASLVGGGHSCVLVTSGAVASGAATYFGGRERPGDPVTLQALSAIGQQRLMRAYDDALAAAGLLAGQVLLAPLDFAERSRYLHARQTLERLFELGVVPIVNENDAIADDEIRFGDNDRLAALVAHLVRADLLVLLTDKAGLYSADPSIDPGATLIEEVRAVDRQLEEGAGPPLGEGGRGGMASKLAAARMAARSGVTALIAAAERPDVLPAAVAGERGLGTLFPPHPRRLPARKLWIAFAMRPRGRIVVDEGAREALTRRSTSLLAAGVRRVEGYFVPDDAVEIESEQGAVFAKGICRLGSERAGEWVGRRSAELPAGLPDEVVHRDDLVVLDDN